MSPGPVVLKFGGTSVADAEAIGRLVRHVGAAHRRARAVVVVSALSGITDRLLHLAAAAAAADEAAVAAGLDELHRPSRPNNEVLYWQWKIRPFEEMLTIFWS